MDTKSVWKLVLVVVVGVALFHGTALLTLPGSVIPDRVDIAPIRAGYNEALLHGTGEWWHGPWIHKGTPALFRPLASYVYAGQIIAIDAGYSTAVTLFNMLLFTAVGVLAGLLAYAVTQRWITAYLAGVGSIFFFPYLNPGWLAYWPLADNLASVLFQLVSLLSLLWFVRTKKLWLLAPAWVGLIISVLVKENGSVTPFVAILLVLSLWNERGARVAMANAGLMVIAVLSILRYADYVIPGRLKANLMPASYWLNTLRTGEYWLILFAVVVATSLFLAWRYRSRLDTPFKRAGFTMAACVGVTASFALAPTADVPFGVYPMMLIGEQAPAMFVGAIYIVAFALFARWLLAKRPLWALMALSLYAVVYPYQAVGMDFSGGRMLFLLPFMALLAAHVIAPAALTVIRFTKAQKTPTSTEPLHLSQLG